MEDNICNMISRNLVISKDKLKNFKEIISTIKEALLINEDNIIAANKIDQKNNNGFIIDFDVIKNIFNNLENINQFYGDVVWSENDADKNVIYGRELLDAGNVIVVTDGNPYVTIEMAVRNILAGNTSIIVTKGYMYGTNKLIIELIGSALKRCNLSPSFVQIYNTDELDDVFDNHANIDLVICIGDQALQKEVLIKTKNKTIVSGYEHFDIYIEDKTNIDFIDEIIKTNLPINIYVKEGIDLDINDSVKVFDVDEAIGQINYTGSRYSASIFTDNTKNASKFIKKVKAKLVTVNTSPTFERLLDIKQRDLMIEKTIIYPMNHKFNNHTINIEMKDN